MARSYSRDELAVRRTVNQSVAPVRDAHGRSRIRLHTLGAAVMLAGDVRIDPSAGTSFSLVLRLAYSPGMHVARDVLLRELWPGQQPTRQRANLRQALYKLRQLGVNAALIGNTVGLDVSQVDHTFSLARTAEQFERDVIFGHEPFGPFLPGYVAAWPDFGEWLETTREAVHADVRRVLVGQLRSRRERADWGGAEALARWLLQFDPLNEDATLTIAECTALAGAKSEAVAILDRYIAEVGATAGDIRLPALLLRRRIAEPVSRGRLSFAPTERHFIGREEELAALTLLMRRTRWHDGCVVLVHGPPGMGKSRLTEELAKVATIEGFRTIRMGCREGDADRPFSIFLDAAPDLMVLPGALGCAPDNLAVLKRWVPSWRLQADETDPSEWTKASLDDVEELPVRRPYPSATSLRRAILDLLAAVSDEKPLLVVIDDTHWIDDASWAVLADLAERAGATRTFVVMTSREPHPRATRPERVPGALQVRPLHPISPESSLALAIAIGEDLSAPIPDALADWFVRAGEGVPLFLRSLVNHWIESGEAGGVPPTLGELIEQRLGKLSGNALRALQTITLLGRASTVRRLQRVLGMKLYSVLDAIDSLHRGGAIVDAEEGVVAAHELIGKAASGRLTKVMASALHERIAEVLTEDLTLVSDSPEVLDVAEHWMQSTQHLQFRDFITSHLHQLLGAGTPLRVMSLLDAAERTTAEGATDSRFWRAKTRLRIDAGEYRLALEMDVGSKVLPRTDEDLADDVANEALSRVDSSFRSDPLVDSRKLGRFAAGVAQLRHLDTETRFRAAEIGLVISSNVCDADLASDCFGALSLNQCQFQVDRKAARLALIYHTIFGELDLAGELAQHQFRLARDAPASTHSYNDCCRAAYTMRYSHTAEHAIEAFTRGFNVASELSLPRLAQHPAWQLAQVYIDVGDGEKAAYWNQTLRGLIDTTDPTTSSFASAHFCRVAVDGGHARVAKQHFDEFAQSLPRIPTARASAYLIALQIGLGALSTSWVPSDDLMSVAERRLETCIAFGTCDYMVGVMLEAYSRADRRTQAERLIHRYRGDLRRERSPLAFQLQRTLKRLAI